MTTIIGPNGCGKSTLLKTMGRIVKQKNGKVYLQDQDLHTIPTKEIAKQLALLPQNPIAPGELKVEELISYGRYPHRKNVNKRSAEDTEVIEWALEITKTATISQSSNCKFIGRSETKSMVGDGVSTGDRGSFVR